MPTTRFLRSFEDLRWVAERSDHVLTLFSGGLDSSYLLQELAHAQCKVTALSIDLGEGVHRTDLAEIADHFGADLLVIDGRDVFARDAVLPAIRAQARYLGIYPISASLSRPIIARYAVETARRLGCDAIVHTANQSQNSLRRLNGAIGQLGFTGYYGTPYEFSAITRLEKIEALRKLGLTRFQARGISGDANLWCREFESGSLDNPEGFWVPESLFDWTAASDKTRREPELAVTYDAGTPVELNGDALAPVELIARLNRQAGAFGIGRFCGLEHLDQGEKVLEVREAPAAHVLMDAYRHLETATLDAELLREKMHMEQVWVREAIEGRWFSALRAAADGFIEQCVTRVSGMVRYRLREGAADVCAIQAEAPIYLTDRDAWEKEVAVVRHARRLADLPSVEETISTV
ncbi:MAG TPA: argininosuccinate synthase-related protein [Burkholderiaceae bacterium]|nr:argininosuccinate synthase-related protein [Burkholderiaceae bacterium]